MELIRIHSISRLPDAGQFEVSVSIVGEERRTYRGTFEPSDRMTFCSVEPDFFFELSELALKRYCNCAIYQMEFMGIIEAYLQDDPLPEFPIELGTTDFGMTRPGPIQILWGRFLRILYRLGLYDYGVRTTPPSEPTKPVEPTG